MCGVRFELVLTLGIIYYILYILYILYYLILLYIIYYIIIYIIISYTILFSSSQSLSLLPLLLFYLSPLPLLFHLSFLFPIISSFLYSPVLFLLIPIPNPLFSPFPSSLHLPPSFPSISPPPNLPIFILYVSGLPYPYLCSISIGLSDPAQTNGVDG